MVSLTNNSTEKLTWIRAHDTEVSFEIRNMVTLKACTGHCYYDKSHSDFTDVLNLWSWKLKLMHLEYSALLGHFKHWWMLEGKKSRFLRNLDMLLIISFCVVCNWQLKYWVHFQDLMISLLFWRGFKGFLVLSKSLLSPTLLIIGKKNTTGLTHHFVNKFFFKISEAA